MRTPRSTNRFASTRCVMVAPTCDLMSSPITGRPFFSKRRCQYGSRAMNTGMQFTNAQPASRICSTYHFVASSEPTVRHPALHRDAGPRHRGKLERVVRLRVDGVREVLAHLVLVDVDGGH